jgi:hypothetical protein
VETPEGSISCNVLDVKEIPTKSLYDLISPLGMVSAASNMKRTLCSRDTLTRGNNEDKVIPGWKLKLRIDFAGKANQ